jgi:FixJ family two-component response regulator
MILKAAKMGISRTVESVFAPTLYARPATAQVPGRGMKELEPLVFVVDDDHSIRTSLANLLATEGYAVEIFASADEYLARVPHSGPACIVLEVQLPGLDGLALQRQLAEEGRREQIVFIARHGDIRIGIGAMKCGTVDFLPKPFRDDELLSAVAQALARSTEVAESRARLAKLTPREFDVFRLVIAGLVNKEIGAELGVALRTIKSHRARVMQKIGVLSVAELVWLAQKACVAPAEAAIATKVPYTVSSPRHQSQSPKAPRAARALKTGSPCMIAGDFRDIPFGTRHCQN